MSSASASGGLELRAKPLLVSSEPGHCAPAVSVATDAQHCEPPPLRLAASQSRPNTEPEELPDSDAEPPPWRLDDNGQPKAWLKPARQTGLRPARVPATSQRLSLSLKDSFGEVVTFQKPTQRNRRGRYSLKRQEARINRGSFRALERQERLAEERGDLEAAASYRTQIHDLSHKLYPEPEDSDAEIYVNPKYKAEEPKRKSPFSPTKSRGVGVRVGVSLSATRETDPCS